MALLKTWLIKWLEEDGEVGLWKVDGENEKAKSRAVGGQGDASG